MNMNVLGPEYEEKFAVERRAALKHIYLCIELFRSRIDKGEYGLLEHPAQADSWQEPVLAKFHQM